VPVNETSRTNRDPFEYDPNELDRQTLAHAKLQNKVAEMAKGAGYEVHQPNVGNPVMFDIAWTSASGRAVVEVKTLSTTKGDAKQLQTGHRAGLGLPAPTPCSGRGCQRNHRG